MSVPEILYNRAYLLTVIALITTVSALGPFFLEELATCAITEDEHGHIIPDETGCLELVAHETLHIAAITFGAFLVILSIIAYRSTKNSNIVFTALAFATFTVLSVFLLAEDLASEIITVLTAKLKKASVSPKVYQRAEVFLLCQS